MTPWPGRALLASGALFLPSLGGAATTAHHSHASLDVTRGAGAHGCPSEKELRRAVSSILGYSPFDANARRRVSAVLSASGGTFHARIHLRDTRSHKSLGVRELSASGPTCEELGSAMALAIALAIDPLAQPPPARVHPVPPLPPVPGNAAPATSSAETASPSAGLAAGAATAGAAFAGSVSSGPGAGSATPRASSVRPPPPPTPALPQPPTGAATPPDAGAEALAAAAPPLGPDAGAPAVPKVAVAVAAEGTDAGAPPTATPPLPEPLPVAPVVAAPAAEAPSPPASQDARPWHGIVGAAAEWTVGLVPQRAFGVLVHGGVAFRVFSLELEVGWLPSTSFAFQHGTISSSLVTAALVGCGTYGGFGLCAVAQTGPLTSQGQGYATVSSSTSWVLAFGVRGQWDWVFAHPVGLRLQATGLVNAVQTRLQVGAEPAPLTAWTSPTFALSLGAGLFLLF
ncbi:MAG: hypothetical protein ACLPJH_09555 [Myxococcaceae bacterium]